MKTRSEKYCKDTLRHKIRTLTIDCQEYHPFLRKNQSKCQIQRYPQYQEV